jgi:hypothetical protein
MTAEVAERKRERKRVREKLNDSPFTLNLRCGGFF